MRTPPVRRLIARMLVRPSQDSAFGENYPPAVNVRKPNRVTVDFVRALDPRPRAIAEIGCHLGHTSKVLAELLPTGGTLHLYDLTPAVDRVVAELHAEGRTNVVGYGNSDRVLDSYNWSLMQVLERSPEPIYDYVLIDGAHTWAHDALAFLLVDRLLKPSGHVDLDDHEWTLADSPALNPDAFPKTAEWYTDEQIATAQIEKVINLLVRRDPRYVEVVENRIFNKVR